MDNDQILNRMHIYGYRVHKPTRAINYKLTERIKRTIKYKNIKLLFVKKEEVETTPMMFNTVA